MMPKVGRMRPRRRCRQEVCNSCSSQAVRARRNERTAGGSSSQKTCALVIKNMIDGEELPKSPKYPPLTTGSGRARLLRAGLADFFPELLEPELSSQRSEE